MIETSGHQCAPPPPDRPLWIDRPMSVCPGDAFWPGGRPPKTCHGRYASPRYTSRRPTDPRRSADQSTSAEIWIWST